MAIGAGSVLTVAGMIAFAMPAFANHVSHISANCNEVVVSFTDFPSNNTPIHIAIQVGSESKSADVNVNENTPPQHVNIMNLTSQLNGQTANVVVDVTWFLDTNHHEHGSFPVTCGSESTSTTAPGTSTVAPTSIQQTTTTTVPVTVTTGGGQVTTTSVGPATTAATESTTTTSIVTSPVTASTGGTSAVSANEASLPFTGGASLPLVVVGLALIIGGAAAVIAPRYRRRSSES